MASVLTVLSGVSTAQTDSEPVLTTLLNGMTSTVDGVTGVADGLFGAGADGQGSDPNSDNAVDDLGTNGDCGGLDCDQTLDGLEETTAQAEQTIDPDNCPDSDRDSICDTSDACLGSVPQQPVLANGCGLQQGLPLVLTGINFETGSAQLGPQNKVKLNGVIRLMRAYTPQRFIIEGHTDDEGPEKDNLELSIRRAKAVFDYFINAGISRQALVYTGKGESSPLVPNQTFTGQRIPGAESINRRIELIPASEKQFAAARQTMEEREQSIRMAEARAAEERRQAEQKRQEQQRRVQEAEESYQKVMEFLQETGNAGSTEQPPTEVAPNE